MELIVLVIKIEDIVKLSSIELAKAWFDISVKPYINNINFLVIYNGNEVIPENLSKSVLDAIGNLHSFVGIYNYTGIGVTTTIATSILASLHPPLASEFTKK